VPEPPLFGRTPEDTGRVWRAISEVVSYLEPPGYQIAGPIFLGKAEESAKKIREQIEPLHAELRLLEGTLGHSPWLAGTEVSAADLVAYPVIGTLLRAAEKGAAKAFDLRLFPIEKTYPAIAAWRERMKALPGYDQAYPPHWRQPE
jgi:glutathione S-transferase